MCALPFLLASCNVDLTGNRGFTGIGKEISNLVGHKVGGQILSRPEMQGAV